jgi:ATP-dependent helicase HepA
LIFVLETAGNQNIYVDRFLPNTPLRIVVDHSGKEVTDKYSVELFNKILIPGQIVALLENETIVETILPNMISAATKIAKEQSAKEITNGLQRMNLTLDHEIGRLNILQKRNKHIRPDEIQMAIEEQTKLTTIIRNARLRLDALQLIRKE